MPRTAALVAVTGLLVAGCRSSSPAVGALEATEKKLGDVRSGTLTLRLVASPIDAAEGTGAGFEIEGPFAVGTQKGSLPVADLRFTRITGANRRTTRFVNTGSRAFVEVDGKRTELSDDQVADLRVTDAATGGGLEGLTLTRWLKDPKLAAGPAVDGAATDKVTGTADAVAILNDIIDLSESFGAGQENVRRLDGDAAERVRRAVAAATAEVVTGKDDRLIRRASASIDLAVTDPRVRDALGNLAGARLALFLEVGNLNKPVQVAEP